MSKATRIRPSMAPEKIKKETNASGEVSKPRVNRDELLKRNTVNQSPTPIVQYMAVYPRRMRAYQVGTSNMIPIGA